MSEGLTARQSLAYARDLAYALQAIHEVGIFHRDLKPGNVMLRDDGSIALIDFGLAKHVALKMEVTDKGLIFGTPHYMSPEQGHGKEIDARSDLYALGVMLYEMLTGKKPFDADNHMAILVHHAKAPIPRLPERIALRAAAHRHAHGEGACQSSRERRRGGEADRRCAHGAYGHLDPDTGDQA